MSEHSPIGWTDATWPIVAGCDYVSPGCSNCWAVRDSWRLAHNPHLSVSRAYSGTVKKLESGKLAWTGMVRPLPERLAWPLQWRKPRRIFVCSQADLFHPKVPFDFIAAAFGVMAMASWHTHQVLTKHASRMREFFAWIAVQQGGAVETCLWAALQRIGQSSYEPYPDARPDWPLPNVWLGVTVEDRERSRDRLYDLVATPAAVRWISYEPALELVDFSPWLKPCGLGIVSPDPHGRDQRIDWIVCGGESAQTRANTRGFDLAWARAARDQCKAAGVPFFMKQLGTRPFERMDAIPPPSGDGAGFEACDIPRLVPAGKSSRYKWHEPEHWPEDLRVQQFPT